MKTESVTLTKQELTSIFRSKLSRVPGSRVIRRSKS